MQDFRDMLGLLRKHGAEFLIVGAHAMAHHDIARATHDLDIWVRASPENAERVYAALAEFGAPLADLEPDELATPGIGVQIGIPPLRIDVMTKVSGLDFESAWSRRQPGTMLDTDVAFLCLADLITNKQAAGRRKDLLDVERLRRQQARQDSNGSLARKPPGLVAAAPPVALPTPPSPATMPAMAKHISIIGDGAMATVCALLLESQGARVTLWGPFPDPIADLIQTGENRRYLPGYRLPAGLRLTADDARAFDDAELVVSAIPTQFVRRVWDRLGKHWPQDCPIVSVAKGIENDTLLRPTQIIADALAKAGRTVGKLGAISGPSIADELARCLPATVCAASDNPGFAAELQQTFTCHWFRVYTNPDLLGIELAGATKNVIAIAAGILDGLQAGTNAKSALLSRGLAEITRLGVAMGASAETFFGIAGVGDLATTCFSPLGRNRTTGESLGRGRKLDDILASTHSVVEGVATTKSVVELAKRHQVEMPITQAVYQVLFEGLDPIAGITQLMSRQLKAERVG